MCYGIRMARKKSSVPDAPKPCDKWVVLTEIQVNGRYVSKGTELKIAGERGRYRFIKQVTTEKGITWVDVYGGPKGYECLHSFSPDRIKTVHSKNKTDFHLAKEYKAKKKSIKESENSSENG